MLPIIRNAVLTMVLCFCYLLWYFLLLWTETAFCLNLKMENPSWFYSVMVRPFNFCNLLSFRGKFTHLVLTLRVKMKNIFIAEIIMPPDLLIFHLTDHNCHYTLISFFIFSIHITYKDQVVTRSHMTVQLEALVSITITDQLHLCRWQRTENVT